MRRRAHRAQAGEDRAREYLLRHGFTILEEQATLHPHMWIDDTRTEFTVRADYVVRKHGRRGVVDAKTGTHAPDPASSDTRRQLLEYARCYDVDDVHLFDAERDRLRKIRFDSSGRRRSAVRLFWWFVTGLLLGATLATIALLGARLA